MIGKANTPATAAQIAAMVPSTAKAAQSGTPADETQPSTSLEFLGNKRVKAIYAWRPYEGGPKNTKTSIFDFSGVSEEQLLSLAMYAVKVKVQAVLRDAQNADPKKPLDAKMLATVDVLKDVVQATSAKADPVAMAIRQLRRAGATDAMVEDVAKQLKASQRK